MIKVGIRAHDIGKYQAQELAKRVKSYGFDGVQLVFKKALIDPVDFQSLDEIIEAFKDLEIFMLGAYYNPVHPNQDEVIKGTEYFEAHLKIANELKANYVGTETGSLMGKPWGYVPENHHEETLMQCLGVVERLVKTAEENQAYIALEGAYNHVVYSPKTVKTVIGKIKSPHLKVTVDLYNFLHIGNYHNREQIFEEALALLKEDIVIFHLKDFVVLDGKLKQVGLGDGLMDYPKIIERIKDVTPNAILIFEGVVGDDIEKSLKFIKKLLSQIN